MEKTYQTFDIFEGRNQSRFDNMDGPIPIIPDSFIGYIVGKPGSGKSHLIKRLLYNPQGFYKKYDLVLFIAPYTIADLPIPSNRMTDAFDPLWIIDRIEEFQKIKYVAKVLVILDDVVSGIKSMDTKKPCIDLFFNRRKIVPGAEISILITSQQYSLLPLKFRSNLQFIIHFDIANKEIDNIKKEHFNGVVRSDYNTLLLIHFKKTNYNFIFIKLLPFQVFLNFDKPI